MVGGGHHFGVAVVDLELRGRDLGVILFVLESHRALHFRGRIDEGAQRIAGQRMIVAAGVHVFELAGLVVGALGVRSIEQEALDLIGGVEGIAVLFVQLVAKQLQHAADVGGVGLAVLIDDLAKNEYFARPENIGRPPVKSSPVNA